MSEIAGIPIGFGSLGLVLTPVFSADKKLECAKAVFLYNEKQITDSPIIISEKQVPIDTREMGDEGHTTDVAGNMYIDTNRDKVIFDGVYFELEKQIGAFWLEVYPNSDFSFQPVCVTQCPAYPASIGDLSFTAASPSISGRARGKFDAREGVAFELMRNPSEKRSEKITYLLTKLFDGKSVSGIDTYVDSLLNSSDNADRVDFAGDVGMFRQRLYIDGTLKINDVNCSHVYFEIGV
jgi:hypothetical protein